MNDIFFKGIETYGLSLVLLFLLGQFFYREFWPWYKKRADKTFETNQEQQHRLVEQAGDHLARIDERTAEMVATMKDVAGALRSLADSRIADNFVLQEVRRQSEETNSLLKERAVGTNRIILAPGSEGRVHEPS